MRESAKRKRWQAVKDAARLADGFVRCAYCGNKLSDRAATVDHDLPRSRGGTHAIHNLVTACKLCNTTKGVMTGNEFRAWLSSPMGLRWISDRNRVAINVTKRMRRQAWKV